MLLQSHILFYTSSVQDCVSVSDCGRLCKTLAKIFQNMPEYVKICQNMPEYAKICQNMPEYAIICQNMPEYARIYQNMPEYARICQNMADRDRLWQPARTVSVFADQAPKISAQVCDLSVRLCSSDQMASQKVIVIIW